jgi:TPP-dependent pyruvate/acetoin dehydrogenase alpha subunit
MATAKNAKSPAGSRIADLGLGKPELEQMLRRMYEIRAFEEKVAYFFSRGMIHGTTHLYVGEEATAVGVISALREEDWISSTHRGHGHTIAKGIDLNRMMAELFGRETGYCKGKGGSMHIADLTRGTWGPTASSVGASPSPPERASPASSRAWTGFRWPSSGMERSTKAVSMNR